MWPFRSPSPRAEYPVEAGISVNGGRLEKVAVHVCRPPTAVDLQGQCMLELGDVWTCACGTKYYRWASTWEDRAPAASFLTGHK